MYTQGDNKESETVRQSDREKDRERQRHRVRHRDKERERRGEIYIPSAELFYSLPSSREGGGKERKERDDFP